MRSSSRLIAFFITSFVPLLGLTARAQISPDSTLGIEQSIVTPNTPIAGELADLIEGGASRGTNLFHSFSAFNIDETQRVYFASPAGIENILSRVTGSDLSTINGLLGTTGDSSANLVLMNPNGIVFGENSQLDVNGSFTATTAAEMQLGEFGLFSATDPASSNLLSIQPSALFFNNLANRPEILVKSQARSGLGMRVPDGEALSLFGGNIAIDRGQLAAWGGRIGIGAVADNGTILLNNDGSIDIPDDVRRGDIRIENDSILDVRLDTDGDIELFADNIDVLSGSQLQTGIENDLGTAESQAGDLMIDATGLVQVSGASSRLGNDLGVRSLGQAGNLTINAASVNIADQAQISAGTFGNGNAGNITIQAQNDVIFNHATAFSTVETGATGAGGNIEVVADSLAVTNGAQLITTTEGSGSAGSVLIRAQGDVVFEGRNLNSGAVSAAFSDVEEGEIGDSGSIEITANSLSVTDNAQLVASTLGRGNAGNIIVRTQGNTTFDNGDALSRVGEEAEGRSGNVDIITSTLSVINGSQLATATSGVGDAGNVIIQAQGDVVFEGRNLDSGITSAALSIVDEAAQGNGGNIEIVADALSITNEAQLAASTFGSGHAGNVTIRAQDSVSVDSGFVRSSVSEEAMGDGGNIEITANALSVINGAQLIASTEGSGHAGNVIIQAQGDAVFDSSGAFSRVGRQAEGNGGSIEIVAGSLSVTNGAQLIATTAGAGSAGSVVIEVQDGVVFEGRNPDSGLVSAAFSDVGESGEGNGGNVEVTANTLSVIDDARLAASTSGMGRAGNVVIRTQGGVVFDNAAAFSSVGEGAEGSGGNIEIVADALLVTNGGQLIAATEGTGNAGNVVIRVQNNVTFSGRNPNNGFANGASSRVSEGAEGDGGNIDIKADSLLVADSSLLSASTASTGSAGDVIIRVQGDAIFDDSSAFSNVNLSAEGDGGSVEIVADTLSMANGAQLSASTFGTGNAGNVVIRVQDDVLFDQANVFSNVNQSAQGSGGDIKIVANSLSMANGAQLIANTEGRGSAGSVTIQVRDSVSITGRNPSDSDIPSAIFSRVNAGAEGDGGNVTIVANAVSMTDGARVSASTTGIGTAGNVIVQAQDSVVFDNSGAFSSVNREARGDGGNIEIVANAVSIANGAQLVANTAGTGNAGNVVIRAQDGVVFQGRNSDTRLLSGAFSSVSEGAQGNGGNVEVIARSLSVVDNARLFAITQGRGNAGDVTVQTQAGVVFDNGFVSSLAGEAATGAGGNIKIAADSLLITNGAGLFASTAGTGDAGNIFLTALSDITIAGPFTPTDTPTTLFTGTSSDEGAGGDITVAAPQFLLTDGAAINASTTSASRGGNITLNTNTTEILRGGQVVATSSGAGLAGSIVLNATGSVTVAGVDSTFAQRLQELPDLEQFYSPNSSLSIRSEANGSAGNLTINSPSLQLDQGLLSAESAMANGGNIALNLGDRLILRNNSQISATAGTDQAGGNGGNVAIASPIIVAIPSENSDITANAFAGEGGQVNIRSRATFGLQARPALSELSDITASSEQGVDGLVAIEAPDTALVENNLIELSQDLVKLGGLLANSCIERSRDDTGSLVLSGRDRLPQTPAETPSTPYSTGTVQPLLTESAATPSLIIEPQAIYRLANGKLMMSAPCEG